MYEVRFQKNWLKSAVNLPRELVVSLLQKPVIKHGPLYAIYLCREELDWCKERNISVESRMVPPDLKECIFEFENADDALLFRLIFA